MGAILFQQRRAAKAQADHEHRTHNEAVARERVQAREEALLAKPAQVEVIRASADDDATTAAQGGGTGTIVAVAGSKKKKAHRGSGGGSNSSSPLDLQPAPASSAPAEGAREESS